MTMSKQRQNKNDYRHFEYHAQAHQHHQDQTEIFVDADPRTDRAAGGEADHFRQHQRQQAEIAHAMPQRNSNIAETMKLAAARRSCL